jgi:ligand-binding sensor domain-containing protein
VVVDKNDHVWIATKAGLSKFDGANWTNYNKKNSALPDNNIRAVFCDNQNKLWVGSKNWLAIIDDGQFTVFDKKTSEIGKAGVFSFQDTPDGDIWLDAGRFIAKYANGEFEFVEELKHKYPRDFLIYKDYIIATSREGILRFNLKTKELKVFDDFLISKEVGSIWKVNDEIWIKSYEPKKQGFRSPTEQEAYNEQRKKIPEEQLRISDKDAYYHFEYMLIKYPLDKLLDLE